MINNIQIKNFKSVKDCCLDGFKRINLFIGRPNVGKTNLIEALSIFSIPYLRENSSKKISSLIRLENEPELFYSGDTSEVALIETNIGSAKISYRPTEGMTIELDFDEKVYQNIKVDSKLNVRGLTSHDSFEPKVKAYKFKSGVIYNRSHARYLIPPFGNNLFTIIESYPDLKKEVRQFFAEYDLELLFDKGSQTLKVVQKGANEMFIIPYSSTADTLQRIIFYKTAVVSNSSSILLFEEPESHSFPPYISHVTQEMIFQKSNQFFISTHSPFILNDFLENCRSEIAVFMVSYENQQTQLKLLSETELHHIYQNGIDLLINSESFV